MPREQKVMEKKEALPSVSMVLPFEPKMTAKSEWEPVLKAALRKVEKELMETYSSDQAMPLITKLQSLLNNLNTATHKKSIAVFVSPIAERIIYMDIPMEERIVVGAPFRARDLVNCRKKGIEYLVLLLSARQSKMYRFEGTGLRLIKSNAPQNVFAYLNEVPERTANFSDPSGRRETMLDKFLHQMDNGLSLVLKAYPLPVFVLCDSRVAGHFATITHNDRHIAAYIHKNCLEEGEQQLLDYLRPYVADWQEVSRQEALRQVEKAQDAGKLAIGLEEVGKMAKYKSSRLLVVEEGMGDASLPTATATEFFISDKVDAIIAKVLENGGDVQWVDKDKLKDYGHIALVQHY
jgi:hypothetical protein